MRPIAVVLSRCAPLVVLALGASGCSGSSSAPPSNAPQPAATSAPSLAPSPSQEPSATFSFTWPAHGALRESERGRSYVSPSIASLSIVVDGGTPIVEEEPAPTGSPQTVTYSIPVAIGQHALTISEFDARDRLLGRGSETITIVKTAANVVDLTLDGDLAQIALVSVPSTFLEGSLSAGVTLVGDVPETFEAIPEDADGNTIASPGAIPAITAASAVPTAIAATNLGADKFSLGALKPTAAIAITASGTDLDGNGVTATFKAAAVEAFYVANFTSQTINVYDNTGTQLTLDPSAFAGIENPSGLTYVPSGKAGVAGTLVVSQVADSSTPTVLEFDTAGNAKTLGSAAFPGTAEPVFAGASSSGANAVVAMPNENSSTVSLYNLAGVAQPQASSAFAKLDRPIGVAYDAHDGDFYVSSFGSATLGRFTVSGAPVGSPVAAGNATEGLAYDSNNNQLYVLVAGTQPIITVSKPVTVGPQLAGVLVYSETPAAITQAATAFPPPSTTAFYEDVVFDPATKDLYITDAGDNKVVAFTETGTSVSLPSGAFANLSDPMGIAIAP